MLPALRRLCNLLHLPELLASGAFRLAILISLFGWLFDAVIDSLLQDTAFLSVLISPSIEHLHDRLPVTLMILLAGLIIGCLQQRHQHQQEELQQQRALLQQIIDSAPECVKTVAADGTLLDMNPAGLRIIGADNLQQVQNNSVYQLIAPEDRDAYIAFNEKVFQGQAVQLEYDIIGLDGRRKRVDSHAVPLYDDQGKASAHLALTRDITDLKHSQRWLKQFSNAIEQCASVVMITDTEAKITYVNSRFCEVTGYSQQEVIGQPAGLLRSGKHNKALYRQLWQQISQGQVWRGTLQNRRKDGGFYWAALVISPLRDDADRIDRYLCTQEDITTTHQLNEQLDYQASHCLLTGLINRHSFERRLAQTIERARSDNSHHAVLVLDIDQFKLINDTCGHIAGDQLLRQVGELLQERVRQHDSVARLGGDQFAVLLEYCQPDEATRQAEKLRLAIEAYSFDWDDQQYQVTVSIGLLDLDRHAVDASKLLSLADSACYIAKELGRNRIYQHCDDDALLRRQGEMQWVARIHHGLAEQRFRLYVQPIARLSDGRIEHYEVLIRYLSQDGTPVSPGAFLPPAERYGLAPKLDRWVLSETCRWLAENPELNGRPLQLSVNLSGLTLTDSDFLEFARQTIQASGLPAGQLCFEITETAAISSFSHALHFIEQLKALGCRFALDDFGSGLSSFGYLKTLPVDQIKIDGLFIRDILSDPIDLAMVRSINEICQLMGKETIAEFVEDQRIADQLRTMGVNYGQGYGIGKPQPIDSLHSNACEAKHPYREHS
ncbi:putative bifunctional diguanylate cyclase/phosphodiesterase [Marinobacterium arenosum]|uniref:putative bifunctional diguanylate cyclase/phosphodiesterase n=1 Tax=Marinobacterium arenosum TaxID=2862496 RepID=UPI001C94EAC7|nr:EAL domain-containing protein [Marinobacterium arenosum]MBY4677032.1 EAL domain-containing protein [Marinobacterium arenosum]